MTLSRYAPLLAAVFTFGCAATPEPVPLVGGREDVDRLAGEWSGSYDSWDTDRHGSIVFSLETARDTAFGDVMMVEREGAVDYVGDYESVTIRQRMPSPPRVLAVRFVVVSGDRVSGTLEPYRDPECGCQLRTVFEGTLDGDTIEGTFVSEHLESGRLDRGRWTMRRDPSG